MGSNGLLMGVAGIILVVVGAVIIGGGQGSFVLGLLALLAGVGLVVRQLLQVAAGGHDQARPAAGRSGAAATPSFGGLFNFTGVKNMSPMSQWVAGGLMAALSLVGLFLYSRATDGMFGLFGGILFFFGLAVVVVLVHKATDYSGDAHEAATDESDSDRAAA